MSDFEYDFESASDQIVGRQLRPGEDPEDAVQEAYAWARTNGLDFAPGGEPAVFGDKVKAVVRRPDR